MKKRRVIYEFGPYRLDTANCRLTRQGKVIFLRPKLFALLVELLEHCGRVVEKDELHQSVWPDTAVEDNTLTVSMNELRRALGNEGYIETVTRRGYRFTAEVKVVAADAA